MTPQQQPDSQAGDELDNILKKFTSVTGQDSDSVDDQWTFTNWYGLRQAVADYAERLAAERAVAELSMAVQTSHDYSDVVEVRSILNGRIKQLSATLTKETK